jgi:hypothetical protein
LIESLVFGNRFWKAKRVDPLRAQLAPHLKNCVLQTYDGTSKTSAAFISKSEKLAPMLPPIKGAPYPRPPPLSIDAGREGISAATAALYQTMKSNLHKLSKLRSKPKQVIAHDMFFAVELRTAIIGRETIWQFYHMVDANDRSGAMAPDQAINSFEVCGRLYDGLVHTTIQQRYEQYQEPFEDAAPSPFVEDEPCGPAVCVSADELAANVAQKALSAKIYLLGIHQIFIKRRIDSFVITTAEEYAELVKDVRRYSSWRVKPRGKIYTINKRLKNETMKKNITTHPGTSQPPTPTFPNR